MVPDAIASVMAQTVPVRIVVVDDGTTDREALAAIAKASAVPTVQLIRQRNAGAAAARNRGLAEADGAFAAFLDADDRWTPDCLGERMARLTADPDLVASFGGYVASGPGGDRPSTFGALTPPQIRPDDIGKPRAFPGGLPMYLFRTDALRAIGPLDESLRMMEDFDLLLRLLHRGGRIAGSNAPTYLRRVRSGSTSRAAPRAMLSHSLEFLAKARRERYFSRPELLRRYGFAYARYARRVLSTKGPAA